MKILKEDDVEHMSSAELKKQGYTYDKESGHFIKQKNDDSSSDSLEDSIKDKFVTGEYPEDSESLTLDVQQLFDLWLKGE